MRHEAEDALQVVRTLIMRGYTLHVRCRNAIHSVVVQGRSIGPLWFDAGTLDAALLQIDLSQFPSRAA